MAGRDFTKMRKILYAVEFLFSLAVLICAAIVIDKSSGWSEINFALFTGVTFMLLSAFYIFRLAKAPDHKLLTIIEIVTLSIWWVFWLSAAAATADFVSWINSADWGAADAAFDTYGDYLNLGYDNIYGDYKTARNAARACCAFCWFTWGVVTFSLIFAVMDEVLTKKVMSRGGEAPAGAVTAAPAVTGAPTAAVSPSPDVAAKV